MKSYFSATELAKMNFPNFPKTRQAVDHKAKKEGWKFRILNGNAGRGGQAKFYEFNSLPKKIQSLIQERTSNEILEKTKNLDSNFQSKVGIRKKIIQLNLPIDISDLNDKQKDTAYARMSLCQEVNKMHQVAGLGIKKAVKYVVGQADAGLLPENLMRLIELANARSNADQIDIFSDFIWLAANLSKCQYSQ